MRSGAITTLARCDEIFRIVILPVVVKMIWDQGVIRLRRSERKANAATAPKAWHTHPANTLKKNSAVFIDAPPHISKRMI